MLLGTYMLAQHGGYSVSAAACINEINHGNGMHLHIEGLLHPQKQYEPTAYVKLYWAPPQPGAGKRLKSMLGPFAETVDSFDNPISPTLIFNPFLGLSAQIEQHFTKVIPFVGYFQGE